MDLYTARKLHSAIKDYLFIYSKCFLYVSMSARHRETLIFTSSFTPINNFSIIVHFAILQSNAGKPLPYTSIPIRYGILFPHVLSSYKVLKYFPYRDPVI